MVLTLIGLLVFLSPFILVFYFKNRILGFLSVFTGLICWHLILALVLQANHFFTYQNVLLINILVSLGVVVWAILKKEQADFRMRLDWRVLAVIFIIFFELLSVHYFYTGTITTVFGNEKVVRANLPYPYFSDEWAGVAFTKYSINNNTLPTTNPLMTGDEHQFFPNIFIGFFALLAELFLLLQIDPVFGFVIFSIFTGTIIAFLVYLFLRANNSSPLAAMLAALLLPFVTNSSKLPGIWHLFPFIAGVIFFLTLLTAASLKARVLTFLAGILSVFLYPPLVVMVAPALFIVFFIQTAQPVKKLIWFILGGYALLLGLVVLFFYLQPQNYASLSQLFFNSIIRYNNEGTIPSRLLWHVIPPILLPIASIGLVAAWRRRLYPLFFSIAIGLVFWVVYMFSVRFLIIDYARIAAITAYLLIIATGLGFEEIITYLQERYYFWRSKQGQAWVAVAVLLVFLVLAFFYTRYEPWRQITISYDTAVGRIDMPITSPANNYLTADDLELFKNIKGERFAAIPWKALTIGAATVNYPIDSKASIITNNLTPFHYFLEAGCFNRGRFATKLDIKYVYTYPFNCPAFKYLGKSSEGLYLYEFIPGEK